MDENLGEKKLAAVQLIKLALMALAGVILVAIMRPYTPVIIAVVFASFWAVLALWGLAASRFRLAGWKLAQPLVLIGLVVCVATVSSHVNTSSSSMAYAESSSEITTLSTGESSSALTSVTTKGTFSRSATADPDPNSELYKKSWDPAIQHINYRRWSWQPTKFILKKLEQAAQRASELRVLFVEFGSAANAGSGIDQGVLPSDLWEVILCMPRDLLVGLFTPFTSS